jgi:hypothetical protein
LRTLGVICSALLALLIGGLLYLLCRPANTRVIAWIREAGFDHWLGLGRDALTPLCERLPAWVLYSLPDGLWSFAYAVILSQLWWNRAGLVARLWLMTIPVAGIGFEPAQALGWIPGTFGWPDLVFCTLGMLLGLSLRPRAPSPTGGHES